LENSDFERGEKQHFGKNRPKSGKTLIFIIQYRQKEGQNSIVAI